MPAALTDRNAALRAEIARLLKLDPFQVLGVSTDAGYDAIRRAFLAAVRRFHPTRFALETAEVREAATERFLVYKRAYDQLADEKRRKTLAAKPAAPRPTPSHPQPAVAPPLGVPQVMASQPAPPPPSTQTADGTGPRRVMTPAHGIAKRPPVEPRALRDDARQRAERFDEASRWLAEGRYREARESFHRIAIEDPHTRKYRVKLHLAWAYEHRAADRVQEAARELERALALEPGLEEAAAALRNLRAGRDKGGILSRLFGR